MTGRCVMDNAERRMRVAGGYCTRGRTIKREPALPRLGGCVPGFHRGESWLLVSPSFPQGIALPETAND